VIRARQQRIERDPNGVTLQAAACEIGVGHGDPIRHFGSAAELQSSLTGGHGSGSGDGAGGHVRSGRNMPPTVAGMVFRVFGMDRVELFRLGLLRPAATGV
jgi:hypothetical protein